MKSYFEEFERRYNRPTMNNITVGFSGIDPAPKSSGSGESSVDIDDFFKNINTIDCGVIN